MSVSVAQWRARWTSNPEVAGSNPAGDEFLVSHEITLFHGYSDFRIIKIILRDDKAEAVTHTCVLLKTKFVGWALDDHAIFIVALMFIIHI